jgi:hypothetical protein
MNLLIDFESYDFKNLTNQTESNQTEYVETIITELNHENSNDSFYSIYIISSLSFVIIIFGLITNFISSLAFSNKNNLSSTNIYLTCLCLVDCIALIGLLINSVIYGVFVQLKYLNGLKLIMFFYPYVYPIVLTSQFANIYLTMSVSINQYITIAFSKGFKMTQNKVLKKKDIKQAFVIVLALLIFSVIFCLPYWFKFSYNEIDGLQRTQISESKFFNKIVHLFLYIPFAYVIPFIFLITTNTYLLIKLTKVNNSKNNIKSRALITYTTSTNPASARAEINLLSNNSPLNRMKTKKNFEMKKKSTMLVAIVFFFLICQFPTLILHLIETESFGQNYKEHLFYFHLVELSKLLLIINLSFNFAFFYLFSNKFRSNLRNVLCLNRSHSDIIVI